MLNSPRSPSNVIIVLISRKGAAKTSDPFHILMVPPFSTINNLPVASPGAEAISMGEERPELISGS